MIESLYVKNFRRFDELNVSFERGMNGVFGSNYRGKSTLLLAIAVALAGPGWARGYNLVRRGQKNFEIQLVLSLAGKRYRVMRSKSGASLTELGEKNDRELANQQGNVNIELGKLIGMPVTRWLELRFVRQKKASTMFEEGSAKLNTLVEELTGVRTISHVIDKLGAECKTLEAKLDQAREMVLSAEDREELVELIKNGKESVTQLTKDLQDAEAEMKAADEMANQLVFRLDDHRQEHKRLSDLVKQREAYDFWKNKLESSRSELPQVDTTSAELNSLIEELTEELGEWRNWEAKAKATFGTLERTEAAVAKLKGLDLKLKDAEAVAAVVVQAEENVTGLNNKLATLDAAIAANTKLEKDLSGQLDSGICQSCHRPFDTDAAHQEQLEKDLEAAFAKDKELTEQRGGLRQELSNAQDTLKRAKADEREILDHNATVARNIQQVEELSKQLHTDRMALDDVQAEAPGVTLEDAAGEVDRICEELMQARKTQSAAAVAESKVAEFAKQEQVVADMWDALPDQADLDTLVAARDEAGRMYEVVTKAHQAARVQIAGIESTLASDRKLLSLRTDTLADQSARLERDTKQRDNMEAMEVTVKSATAFRKYLRDNRSRYLQNAWDVMLGRASVFASSITEGYITNVSRTEAGQFEFTENGETAQMMDASGAQAAILGMAVQASLAETLPTTLDLFMADEPAADMDAAHSGAALIALSSLAKQAVVISHHRMDESLCSQVIEL